MKKGPVQVHTCYSVDLGEPRPKTYKELKADTPKKYRKLLKERIIAGHIPVCMCRMTLSHSEAEGLVKKGFARYIVGYDRPKPYEDQNRICMTGIALATPRAETIDRTHLERAYVDGDLMEQARINEYGILNRETLLALVTQVPQDEFDAKEKTDYGIPVINWNTYEGRTPGGYAGGQR